VEASRTQAEDELRATTAITLKATGVTLLGVIASIGVSVGFGLDARWWIRLLAGAGSAVGLALLVRLGSGSRRGPLTRLANWMIGAPHP
jgi:hypothetical protein